MGVLDLDKESGHYGSRSRKWGFWIQIKKVGIQIWIRKVGVPDPECQQTGLDEEGVHSRYG